MKNIFNKTLKKCTHKQPVTGFKRNGYCQYDTRDFGRHLICAKLDKNFLDYTAKMGNNLYSVVKPGDKWCICEGRYLQAYQDGIAPRVIRVSTSNKIGKRVKRLIKSSQRQVQGGGKLLPKLRNISKKNKLHIYRLYDPPYKRRLAIHEGIHDSNLTVKQAAVKKKARFNVLRQYRKNNDKEGCINLTQDMRYIDKKYGLGKTNNICK